MQALSVFLISPCNVCACCTTVDRLSAHWGTTVVLGHAVRASVTVRTDSDSPHSHSAQATALALAAAVAEHCQ